MSKKTWLPVELGKRPRLLVVDDQAINVRLLHELFRKDCDVLMATSGESALAVCCAQLPDLVLLDVMMPDVNGHEVCRLLKLDPATKDIPVIFVTGQHTEEDEVAGFELGAVDFIVKPVNPVIVRARVRNHLINKLQGDVIRTMALIDGLTGISNRRKFEVEVERSYRYCLREKFPMSVFMIDVDYFKRYNDRYGHQAGDRCLHDVAQALKEIVQRPYDIVARYGGEEFSCLLAHTDGSGAQLIAQRMLKAVRQLNIEHLDAEIEKMVTVSIGIATATPTDKLSFSEVLEAADAALYTAKKSGRNQFCMVSI